MPAHTTMASHEAMASPMPGHSATAGAMPTESAMAGHAAMSGHGMGAAAMMNQPILVSHVIVGGLLHLAMSAAAGVAFAVVLAVPQGRGVWPAGAINYPGRASPVHVSARARRRRA